MIKIILVGPNDYHNMHLFKMTFWNLFTDTVKYL